MDRKRVARGATIKTAGHHEVEINLYRDINAIITVLVGIDEEAPEAGTTETSEPKAEERPEDVAE